VGRAEIRRRQERHNKGRSGFKKLFTKKGIKNFIKSPRVAAPILAYLILLGPILYLYSGSPPETEVQVYKGSWGPVLLPNSLAGMKDMGMNTVFIQDFGPFKELLVANIQTAHRNGLKVVLTTGFMPPYPKAADLDLEDLNSKIIDLAKLAEEYGVEFFSPLNEPDCIFWENTARWGQEILPRIREVYHGEIIWKGAIFCFIDIMRPPPDAEASEQSGEWPTDFSGYDYIGFSMSPRAGMTLEEYPQFVDNVLNATLAWAERDNCKGVMVTEFGTWEWEPWHSEEDVARPHEIVLERGENKVVGFFVLDFLGSGTGGKTGEVIRRWYKEIL